MTYNLNGLCNLHFAVSVTDLEARIVYENSV